MWKLNKIDARNLCAFQQLSYNLQQGVTTLIFGDNRDNENQRSNGSGKSALIESIALGIAGTPLRKIRNEEIINDNAEECNVCLHFVNDTCDEEFIVERTILRKGSSSVSCRIIRDGQRVTTDEAVRSSVDAYNKYILEKLGITKDELFNNFILSRHKYQDFLSCSDKDKKEIINRFSNGILVDQAIQKIMEDIAPLENDMNAATLEMAGIDGRIQILTEQIEHEENSKEEIAKTKAEKIEGMLQTIAEKRNAGRVAQTRIIEIESREKAIREVDKKSQDLENSDVSLEECIPALTALIVPLIATQLTDWNKFIEAKKQEIEKAGKDLEDCDKRVTDIEAKVASCKEDNKQLQSEYAAFCSTYKEEEHKITKELESIGTQITETGKHLDSLKFNKRNLSGAIENLKGKLAGTISCPSCAHQFILADKNFDVTEGKEQLHTQQEELLLIENSIQDEQQVIEQKEQSRTVLLKQSRTMVSRKEEWDGRLSKAKRALENVEYDMQDAQTSHKRIMDFISGKQKEIEEIRRKVYDEVFDLIDDALRECERSKKTHGEEIQAAESSVKTLQQTIHEMNQSSGNELLRSLKDSLKATRKQSADVLTRKTEAEEKYNRLAEQAQHFVMFKTFLANTKIEALSRMTNEILEDIGSDIRVQLSGYTVLKSGNVREKISASILRDGIDCGSFAKFSEGEKARVNLATIIAMQKLVNGNCDTDKGFDLLVIDELLDSFDEAGLACTFSALNRLGVTALVVSHGHTSESYPYKITIVKEHGVSEIKD